MNRAYLSLAVIVLSPAVGKALADCSRMETIRTSIDVDRCLKDKNGLEAWKNYWKIDSELNPIVGVSHHYEEKFPDFIDIRISLSGWIRVRGKTLQSLGYTKLDRSSISGTRVSWVEQGSIRRDLWSGPGRTTPGQAYKNRWAFAEDVLRAVEIELGAREVKLAQDRAAYEAARRDREALAKMELVELQELSKQPEKFSAERMSIDEIRQDVASFRGFKGALDRVTERFRDLMFQPISPRPLGPTFSLLTEGDVQLD